MQPQIFMQSQILHRVAIGLFALLAGCVSNRNRADFTHVPFPGGWGGIEMVKIESGSFKRYDAEKNEWVSETISRDFWIGKCEITQGQFEALMGRDAIPDGNAIGINMPMNCVTWEEAEAFCHRLNLIYKNRLPPGYRFDLPTVVQWEYACCAGTDMQTQSAFYDHNPHVAGWTYFESPEEVQPVGLKMPNAWGICDMHGNVIEWCRNIDETTSVELMHPTEDLSQYASACGWGIFTDSAQYDLDKLSVTVCKKSERAFYLGFRIALVPVETPKVLDYDCTNVHE